MFGAAEVLKTSIQQPHRMASSIGVAQASKEKTLQNRIRQHGIGEKDDCSQDGGDPGTDQLVDPVHVDAF